MQAMEKDEEPAQAGEAIACVREACATLAALDTLLRAAGATPLPAMHLQQLLRPALQALDRATA